MTTNGFGRAELGATYLPVGQMLQIDRVTHIADGRIVCEMDIAPSHWVFPLHFPDDPIFPGCLLIEAAGQVVALYGWETGLRGRPRMAKVSAEFEQPVLTGDTRLTLAASVRRRRNMCFGKVEIRANGRLVGMIEPVIVVLAPESD